MEKNREEAVRLTREKVTIHEMINFDKTPENPVKVSIVVPVCNVEQYLHECIDSCVNQTLRDIEIICVNDGSTDSCPDILREYAEKDERVKVVNKDNAGYGHTMNLGMDLAQGEYIGIVESDDFVELYTYETLYSEASKFDLDFIKGDFYRFIETANGVDKTRLSVANSSYYNKLINPQEQPEVFQFNMQTWTAIYKKSFIESNNIRHNETPGASFQDNGFCYKTYCSAKKIFYLNIPVYNYRFDNPNSSIHNKGKIDMIKLEFDLIKQFVDDNADDISNDYWNLFYWKKYKSYLYTVERIAYEIKWDFFFEFSGEFRYLRDNGYLDQAVFEKSGDWDNLNWIVDNPEEYYDLRIKSKKVSVIVPVFNVEPYIKECLDSIIGQTLSDIEIICINDGSTDKSGKIISEIAAADKRIRVYNQRNIGVGATRNKGIDFAHGEFVIFMDPDDFYPDNDVLETLYNNAIKSGVMVSGGSFSDFINGKVNTTYKGTLCGYTFQDEGVMEYSDYQFDFGFHRFIYNTEMLRQNKIYFPKLKRFQDPPFFIMAMKTAQTFYATTKIVYRYRRNHKAMEWTIEKLTDALNGVALDLKISSESSLIKLHSITVQRLFITFRKPIHDLIDYSDINFLGLLSEINRLINEDLIDPEIVDLYRHDFMWTILIREFNKEESAAKKLCKEKEKEKEVEAKKLKKEIDRLRDVQTLNKEIAELECRLKLVNLEHEIKIADLQHEFKQYKLLSQQRESYQTEIISIRSSLSYKIGRAFTWLPRLIRGLFKK